MNAFIWVRQGKKRLALANISGAMMIQATIPTAFGLFYTPVAVLLFARFALPIMERLNTDIAQMHLGILLAHLSAALFGASTPLAKILIGSVNP